MTAVVEVCTAFVVRTF